MSSHLPELGIGLANHLYPTACQVVPTRKAQPPPPDAFAQQLQHLQESLHTCGQKCADLERTLAEKSAECINYGRALAEKSEECLNYERKLFVLESAAAAATHQHLVQPVFFPYQGGGPPARAARVEEVSEPFIIDSSLGDGGLIFEQEPDGSLFQAFAVSVDVPIVSTPPAAAAAATIATTAAASTTRRVNMADLILPTASTPRTPEGVAALAASLANMSEKEMQKLSVETLVDHLSAFGKVYTKPKLAAAKLLHATAKAHAL